MAYIWTRGSEANRAANTTVPAAAMLGVTNEGNVYASDGTVAWKDAPRLARATEVAAAQAAAVAAAASDASSKATAAQTAAATAAATDASSKVATEATARAAAIVAGYTSLARTPDALIAGAVTRDSNGAATTAPVQWPDGTPGTYTALVLSTTFPGAVDSYQITYGSPVTKTYTQPTITRDTNGAATTVPAIVAS